MRQKDQERLAVIRSNVRNGACLNENELVHLDPNIRTTEGFIASSMFGVGAGPAGGSKHCQQLILDGLRQMHEGCGEIKTRVRTHPPCDVTTVYDAVVHGGRTRSHTSRDG